MTRLVTPTFAAASPPGGEGASAGGGFRSFRRFTIEEMRRLGEARRATPGPFRPPPAPPPGSPPGTPGGGFWGWFGRARHSAGRIAGTAASIYYWAEVVSYLSTGHSIEHNWQEALGLIQHVHEQTAMRRPTLPPLPTDPPVIVSAGRLVARPPSAFTARP